MNRKKLAIDAVVILLGLITFFTWHNNSYQPVATTSISNYEVYLITMDKKEQFWNILDRGARDMAAMLGVNYYWVAPDERDAGEQIKIFNEAVEAGADIIMLAAVDPVRISGAIENAKAKGVKIIYVDAPAVEEGIVTLATDNYSAGRLAGEIMISELEAVGIKSGTIGIIGVTPITTTTIGRENGFRDVLNQNGNYVILDTEYTEGDPDITQRAAERIINENPDLVGIFATNEGSTIGTGNAIKASNRKGIIGIGFDITDEIEEMIRTETLQAVLAQNPYTMGYLGMAEAAAILKGYDTGPSQINTGVSVVTRYQPKRPPISIN